MWNGLILRMVKGTPLTYTELKAVSVDEFFKLLITHVDQQREDKQKSK